MTSRVALKVAMRAAGNSPGAAGALGASLSGRGSLWAPVAPAMASVGASRGQSSPTAVAMEEQVRWVNLKVVRERMKTVSNIGKVRWGGEKTIRCLSLLRSFSPGGDVLAQLRGALVELSPCWLRAAAAAMLLHCGGSTGEWRFFYLRVSDAHDPCLSGRLLLARAKLPLRLLLARAILPPPRPLFSTSRFAKP